MLIAWCACVVQMRWAWRATAATQMTWN